MNQIFAERLKQLREEQGLTQAQLAEIVGVDFRTVSIWERGIRPPKDEYIIELCYALGVEMVYCCGQASAGSASEITKLLSQLGIKLLYNKLGDDDQIFIKNIQRLISILQKETTFYDEVAVGSFEASRSRVRL